MRVSELNDLPGLDVNGIDLLQEGDGIKSISISDAAEVCVCSLLDPAACNKSFYVSKATRRSPKASLVVPFEEGLTAKFSQLKSNS